MQVSGQAAGNNGTMGVLKAKFHVETGDEEASAVVRFVSLIIGGEERPLQSKDDILLLAEDDQRGLMRARDFATSTLEEAMKTRVIPGRMPLPERVTVRWEQGTDKMSMEVDR